MHLHILCMADPNFSWIYLIIFLAIPMARIIPKIIDRYRNGKSESETFEKRKKQSPTSSSDVSKMNKEFDQPLTREKQVLGELHKGSNTFEKIQKNTGFDSPMLNSILEELEKNGLMKVIQKQGMFGPKVELYSTEKGFKEYYS